VALGAGPVALPAKAFAADRAAPRAASAAPARGRAKGSGLLLEELVVRLEAVSFRVVQADRLADRVVPEVGSRPSGSSSGR